jgi:small subunit ribosomal protein S18
MPTYKGRKCMLCTDQIKFIDYKNTSLLRKYLSQYYKIVPKYYNGNCLKHQKMVSRAIKNARMMALMPFTSR